MLSGDMKNHTRRTAKRFGLGKKLKQGDASLPVNENTTAWEIYNNRATKTDTEIIKDCNDSLNTLLIFVCSVFSLCLPNLTNFPRPHYIPLSSQHSSSKA
jgi:Family of unknown function (DUF6535)